MTQRSEFNLSEADEAVPELDRMLARAVAGDSEAMLWVRMRGAADPVVLEELVLWQSDALRIGRAAHELALRADRVSTSPLRIAESRQRSLASGLGWAIAAVLALALAGKFTFTSANNEPRSAASPTANVAGFAGSFASTDDAFDAYVQKARSEGALVGSVAPPTLVRSRELGNGNGFEVIVIRQVYERRTLPEVYRLVPTGETGVIRPEVVRARTMHTQ